MNDGQDGWSIHDPIEVSEGDKIEARDILRRRRLAARILNRLKEVDCPGVLGVYGGWGTGKTSLVNLLKSYNNISGEPLKFLEIDAWKYESGNGLLIPVVVKLRELAGNGEFSNVWRLLARRASMTALLAVSDALLGPFGSSPSRVMETYEKLSSKDDPNSHLSILERWERQSEEIEQTERAFKTVVNRAVEHQGGRRILICVDNLDRCSPENVVKLLESVKVFFNAPGCVWLFAMDSEVVAGYINKKYQGTGVDGFSYLDKIVPEQYHLSLSPFSDGDEIEALLRYAAEEHKSRIDMSKIPQIPKALVPRRLIKSARKFSDFYKGKFAEKGVPPETVMALCMLYHTWPDFYQRLSSGSREHIRGILDNFFHHDDKQPGTRKEVIPLSESFLHDMELVYFVRSVFSGYSSDSSGRYVIDIVNGMEGLREGGLP